MPTYINSTKSIKIDQLLTVHFGIGCTLGGDDQVRFAPVCHTHLYVLTKVGQSEGRVTYLKGGTSARLRVCVCVSNVFDLFHERNLFLQFKLALTEKCMHFCLIDTFILYICTF